MLLAPSKISEQWARWDAGSRQRYSAYWQDIADTDPTFRTVFVTVELVFGDGSVLRLARAPLTTTSGLSGTEYEWEQGLIEEPEVTAEVQLGSQAAAARSVSVTLPAGLVDISQVILNGGILAGLGEVCLQVDGGDYDKRWVLLRGDVSGGVSFGTDKERLQVQITDARLTTALLVPETVLDTTRWSTAQEDAIGLRYPIVINGYPYVPAIRVDPGASYPSYLLCQDGRNLDIAALYQNGSTAPAATETESADALGTPVLLAVFTAGTWAENDAVYADLTLTSGAVQYSVIQCLELLLRGYTSLGNGLNPDLFGVADSRMPGVAPKILINASGDQTVNILDFCESTLLASFPMIHLVYEGRGLGPVVIDQREPAIAVMSGGVDLIERVSLYSEVPKSSLYTSYSLRYSYNAQDNTWGAVKVRDAETDGPCQKMRTILGGDRPRDPIDSPYIFSDVLGGYVLDWLVDHYSRVAYEVEWTVLPGTLMRLRLGSNITYTDSAYACFTACKATVMGMTWARGKASVRLRIWL